MNPHNDFEIFDDFGFEIFDDYGFEIDNTFYFDGHYEFSIEITLFYLVKAVVNHRINQLDKDLIHSSDDLLGDYFKKDKDGEDQLAPCCLERLIELGQLPIMEIPRNDNNDRKYILL